MWRRMSHRSPLSRSRLRRRRRRGAVADGRPRRLCLTWGLLVCPGVDGAGGQRTNQVENVLAEPRSAPPSGGGCRRPDQPRPADGRNSSVAGSSETEAHQRQAMEVLAEVYLRDQRLQEAAALLARCVKKHSNSWRCRTIQGRMLLARANVKRAVATLKKAIAATALIPGPISTWV